MKKCFSFFLSLLFLTLPFIVPSGFAYAATKEELEQKISDIDSQIAENKNQLSQLENQKNTKQEYLDTLENQISTIESKVTALETQIESIDGEIETCNSKIKQLQNETAVIKDEISAVNQEIKQTNTKIESSKGLLCEKLRCAYMNNNQSNLQILMGSENLADFLTRLELMKRISQEDKKVIDEFKETADKLKKSKAELTEKQAQLDEKNKQQQEQKTQLVEKKKELVRKQSEHGKAIKQLESNYAEIESYISQLDKNSAIYKNYIKNLQEERAEADAEIDRIINAYQATTQPTTVQEETLPASNNNPTSPGTTNPPSAAYTSGDTWAWPLGNASCYISSGFGYRDASISGWAFHGGMDITGGNIYGKTIYASRAGTVVTATWSTSRKGYGNYVVIDHADGYMTLYGHCSSLLVTTGQKVSKGQAIAKVGDSGNVTGTHLHFEVRYNAVKQNPANYVKKP
ncbi:MAG: murein hydrolase activator EnvC family protein [Acutalibacteraceae bacterium]